METEPADCEGRLERQPGLRGGPRLVQLAGKCESSGELEMSQRETAIGLDAAMQPCDSFAISTKLQLGECADGARAGVPR